MSNRWLVFDPVIAFIGAFVVAALITPDSWGAVALAAAAAGVVTFAVLCLGRRRQARAIVELQVGLRRLGEGSVGSKVYAGSAAAFVDLTRTFNTTSEQLANRIAALEDDRRQLRAILSGMIEGVISVDAGQRIVFANERAARLLDFAPKNCAGKRLWEIARHRKLQELVAGALTTDEARRAEIDWTGPPARHLDVYAARLGGSADGGAVVVLYDVSELRRLERLRQDFVANVSHELKTPLAVIKVSVETLLSGAVDDIEHRGSFLDQIDDQANRLHALILDLLSLARIESGAAALEPGPVSLKRAVHNCLERQSSRATAKRQTLEAQSDDVTAWADEEGVETILDNLIDNAIKYTPDGGRIVVSCAAVDGEAVVTVSDTGIGIPEADQARVFERFYRVDKARSRELGGTGLGLAIVKHLAQSLHGSVAVESQPGRGTTMRVRLPLAEGRR